MKKEIKVGSESPIDLGKATSADIKVILTFRSVPRLDVFRISVSVINHSISNAAEIADLSAHHICLKLRDLFA